MTPEFQRLMADAARLVRGGDLQAATAAIQAALHGNKAAERAAASAPAADGIVIDVEARELAPPRPHPAEVDKPERPPAPGEEADAFVAGRFSDGRMQRNYKLYIPPHAGERPLPLVLMLHGCTQDPDDFARGTRMNEAARAHGCFVLYPAQSQQANPQRCWNWFKHSHQQRGRGEPALLAAMTRQVMARHGIDPRRVYVAGLSAGGAMAAILGEAYPELFAAAGVHSGLAAGAAKDLPSALAAMRTGAAAANTRPGVPTIVFHGDADATVHPANGDHVVTGSVGGAPAQAQVERQRAGGGRGYTRHVHRAPDGTVLAEHWVVHGSGHAWSGGSREGSFTDPAGPDATAEMLRFFLAHPRG
ncbi:extracellular catalytic domain type 1 short-chain-length polyhydroxyalkanoate depolymerase [Ramlibacter alkalitolerans]|uniref:PHB depolymerase family esterase n=1 Tax=Ramlibacter alkalitolerans TaxID=2039631 RepID=A0ABS1JIW4_9BURK|nr:PHB depolymerase family esterase [Ramlibacter alkalitolerans]MBL0424147.1 PHB depolymerase family esterase [Ramlibacter alkalitolerans]